MRTRYVVAIAILLGSTSSGCRVVKSLISDDEAADAGPAIPAAPSAATTAEPEPPPSAKEEPAEDEAPEIKTVVDFEEEAFERVTKETVKVRVDDLAREIEKE